MLNLAGFSAAAGYRLGSQNITEDRLRGTISAGTIQFKHADDRKQCNRTLQRDAGETPIQAFSFRAPIAADDAREQLPSRCVLRL